MLRPRVNELLLHGGGGWPEGNRFCPRRGRWECIYRVLGISFTANPAILVQCSAGVSKSLQRRADEIRVLCKRVQKRRKAGWIRFLEARCRTASTEFGNPSCTLRSLGSFLQYR